MLVPLLLAALILLIAVVAYIVVGRDRVERAWDDLPGPVRTVLNVFVAGSVAVVGAAHEGAPDLLAQVAPGGGGEERKQLPESD